MSVMGGTDEFGDEPMLSDEDVAAVEKDLFAAIREAHNLDLEIDDEYRRLASGEYDGLGPTGPAKT